MSSRNYKQGQNREQAYLMPARIDDYISENNPVRAIDIYVESLDMAALGFKNASGPLTAGQPGYAPQEMGKLYLHGYMNKIRSSRRLAHECCYNLEAMWLMGGLQPGYRAIAEFRRENLEALKAMNKDFVQVCKELNLFGNELVSIDGSFFRGNVAKGSIYTEERLTKELDRLEKQIAEYMEALETADTKENAEDNTCDLGKKLAQLKLRQEKNQGRLVKLQASGEKQLAEVDEDARLLSKRGQSVAGYNVQAVVDKENKLLVVCEVTQDGNDQQQLAPMAQKAKEVLGVDKIEAVADSGYFSGPQILECEENGITPYVPEPNKQDRAESQGRFPRADYIYDVENDVYICPAEQIMERKADKEKDGKQVFRYVSDKKVCDACPLRGKCLPPKTPYREINRWEHEARLDGHRKRMQEKRREKMALRASLSEHPFGTLKQWCGWTHFLLRGKAKVSAEMSLLMLAYNFRRVLTILGVQGLREYFQKRAQARLQNAETLPFFALCKPFTTFCTRLYNSLSLPRAFKRQFSVGALV